MRTSLIYDLRQMDNTTYVDGSGWVLQAEFRYDGHNNRLQQIAYGSGVPVTTCEPYGKLLAQTGSSGTVYGYTGEAQQGGSPCSRQPYHGPALSGRDPIG